MAIAAILAILIPWVAPPEGLFARQATSIGESIRWSGPPSGRMSGDLVLRSPDRRSILTIRYRESGNELKRNFRSRLTLRLASPSGTSCFLRGATTGDVLWSPDSKRVALSLSGGGVGGVYDLVLMSGRSTPRILSAPFRRRLNPPRRRDLRAFSNVAAVKWLSSTRLLVAAQQLYEDSCPQRGRAMLYSYDLVTRRILHAYAPETVRRLFPSALGSLLD
jgi:hypothetical protein